MILVGLPNQIVHRCYAMWMEMKKQGEVKNVVKESDAGGFHWTVRVEKLDGTEIIVTTKEKF